MSDPFKAAETQYLGLRGRLAVGRLSQTDFDEALRALTVRDAQGRFWRLSQSGQWLVHDGQAWVRATPNAPGGAPPLPESHLELSPPATAQLPPYAPPSLPESHLELSLPATPKPPPYAPPHSGRPNRAPLLLLTLLLLLVLGLLGALGIALNQGALPLQEPPAAQSVSQNPAASVAPTPATPTLRPVASTATPALASSSVPGIKVSIIAAPTPQPILAKDFSALGASLAQKIAALNQAELKFIRDMRALSRAGRPAGLAFPPLQKGSLTEEDLKDLAGKAMDVAILADQMAELATKQDKGSNKAAQSAEPFFAIARNAFSLVVDAQNVRQALQNGLIPGGQAIDIIASYGAQLWNSTVTDGNTKGNPFSAQTKSGGEPSGTLNPTAAAQVQSQTNGLGAIWIAKSNAQNTRTLDVPAAQSPIANPFDPQVKNAMTTASGQSDGNKAQQVASANLQTIGATADSTDASKPTQLQVPSSPVAVAGGDQIKGDNIPTFKSGKATIVSKDSPGGDPFMQSVGLNGGEKPTDQGKSAVQDQPALVGLSLSNIVISSVNKHPKGSGTFEADVNFSFSVNWSTNLAAPQFTLNCNSGRSNAVSQASGALNLNAHGLLILYPGTLTIYCYATSTNGQSLGSVSVNVLVGDAADATTRAIQVETDSAILDITLTADAQATESVKQTQTAVAKATNDTAATQTAQAQLTIDALSTEVAKTATAEFRLTAAAFATRQAQPPPATSTPTATPTFTPKVVDQLTHPGNVLSVSTRAVLQRGRLYRFTFSGRVNLINPTRSVSANQLPEHVNGVTVSASGIVVIQGTGGVATISCGSGTPDPNDPGGYGITVEDLGPF